MDGLRVWLRAEMNDVAAATTAESLIRGSELNETSSTSLFPSSSGVVNYPLISALVAFACSIDQILHHLICRNKEGKWEYKRLVGSGGKPSFHSATVSALVDALGFREGFGGSPFAVALVLAIVLNQIVYELPAEHPLADSRPLWELLGLSPPQVVAGCLLGIANACIGRLMRMIGS